MAQSALETIEGFDHAELQKFFENNGMSGYSAFFSYSKEFNGKAFLNIKPTDAIRWKKLLSYKQLEELVEFAISVKQNPENYLPSSSSKTVNVSTWQIYANDEVIKQLSEFFTSNKSNNRAAVHIPSTSTDTGTKNAVENLKIPPTNASQEPVKAESTKLCHNEKSMEPNSPIHESEYFMNISRKEAEDFLKSAAEDGTYLFRPGVKHHYAISVLVDDYVRHFRITSDDENKLQFEHLEGVRFDSLTHMVKYFREHSTFKTAKREIKLTNPLVKS